MLLIIEQLLIHAAFIFMNVVQGLYELSLFLFHAEGQRPEQQQPESNVECRPLWGLPPIESPVMETPEVLYTATTPTDEQNKFFAMLIDEIAGEPAESEDNTILRMDSWQEEETTDVAVPSLLSATANSKIGDSEIGEQLWVAEVIGEEQSYIHVSDGSGRAWIDCQQIGSFGRRDIVSLHVNRLTDARVELITAELLQSHSEEFCLLDDDQYDELNFYESEDQYASA